MLASVQISYSAHMDHLEVLRDKIGRLRREIADVQKLNQQFRRDGGTAGMEQAFKSLTHRGVNGYRQSSISLCNSQSLAAELFLRNK